MGGYELKRVPLDFAWPPGEVWRGYVNPYWRHLGECRACGGSGLSRPTRLLYSLWRRSEHPEAKMILNDAYDPTPIPQGVIEFADRILASGRGWSDQLDQDDIDALAKAGFNRDNINASVCVDARASRYGAYGACDVCRGRGYVGDPETIRLHDAWQPEEPPEGDGWQVWRTINEGMPVSPVFASKEEVIEWIMARGFSRRAAEAFIVIGSAPSLVTIVHEDGTGHVLQDFEALIAPEDAS